MKNALTISKLVFFLLVFISTLKISAKTIYYVKQNATGNGSSWTNASGNIQSMIDKAVIDDEIWVAKGTYSPANTEGKKSTFKLKNGVNIYGGFAGSEIYLTGRVFSDLDSSGTIEPYELLNTTILSGQNGYYYHVVTGNLYFTRLILNGFTIEGGNALDDLIQPNGGGINAFNNMTIQGCIIKNCSAKNGGGIYGLNSAEIRGCYFEYCKAQYGAGGGVCSQGLIENCKVNECSGSEGGGIAGNLIYRCKVTNCKGGGIYARSYTADHNSSNYTTVYQCEVINCTAGIGGGIESSYYVSNCKVNNCTADITGGGIYLSGKPNKDATGKEESNISNCFISNCKSGGNGGGISTSNSIIGCTIINCFSNEYGGGIYHANGVKTEINDCAVFNCMSRLDGGGIYSDNSLSFVQNCAVNNNKSGSQISNIVFGTQIKNITPNITTSFIKPTTFIGTASNQSQIMEIDSSNWELIKYSPLINKGNINNNETGRDINNKTRPLYYYKDIGAYEFMIPYIFMPIEENFNNWTDFKKSQVIYGSSKLDTINNIKWSIENQKVVFSKNLSLTNYKELFFTYQINAKTAKKVILRFDMEFEASTSIGFPLGTEKLFIEFSFDLITWQRISDFSNQNGTIKNKTYLHDISHLAAYKSFYLRFNAEGINTNRIGKWVIDNILIDKDGLTTDIQIVERESLKYSINDGVLQIHNLNDAEKVQLYDLNGRQLYNFKPSEYPIQLQLPNRGVYIVRTQSETGVTNQKVVWE